MGAGKVAPAPVRSTPCAESAAPETARRTSVFFSMRWVHPRNDGLEVGNDVSEPGLSRIHRDAGGVGELFLIVEGDRRARADVPRETTDEHVVFGGPWCEGGGVRARGDLVVSHNETQWRERVR